MHAPSVDPRRSPVETDLPILDILRHFDHDLKNLSRRTGTPFRLPIVLKRRSPSSEETKIPRLKKCVSAPKVDFWLFFSCSQSRFSKKLGHSTRSRFCLRVLDERNGSLFEGNRNRTIEKSNHNPKLWQNLSIDPATIFWTGKFSRKNENFSKHFF